MSTIPTVTELPVAPLRTDAPSVFADRADAFVAALTTFRNELNALGVSIETALAGNLVQFDGYQGTWTAGTYASGDVVFHTPTDTFYISLAGGNSAEPPAGNWRALATATSTPYNPSGVALTSTNVQSAIDELCTLPPQSKSDSYTLAAADVGGVISISSGTITVPSGVFSSGDVIVLYNNSTTDRPIARAIGVTMFWINGANANRTLSQRGLATLVCVGTNTFVITGQGLA
jgi:hypothetical protein